MGYESIAALVTALFNGEIMPDDVDIDAMTDRERGEFLTIFRYEAWRRSDRARGQGPAQHRALGLFRSLLTPDQHAEWRRRRCVTVRGSAGGRYRIYPVTGQTERVERHGRRWFCRERYCYHDPLAQLPNADTSIAHLLLLTTDEPGFLAAANATARDPWRAASEMRTRRREMRTEGVS